jgi:hypothetical protein
VLSIGANISAIANELVYSSVMHSITVSYSFLYFYSETEIASGKKQVYVTPQAAPIPTSPIPINIKDLCIFILRV